MERSRRFLLWIPTGAVAEDMHSKDRKRARRAVSDRLRWFVAQLMRLFKTTSAELLERAEAKAKADAASSPDRYPPDRSERS
jgi:hypothetical protein